MLNINTKLLLVKHIIIINISLFRMSTKLKSSQFLQNRLFNTQHPFIGLFMVMWHLTMELLTTKCHERATFRKLWHQRGNRSLLPAKWWPLLHMIRACSWRWPDVVAQHIFENICFCFVVLTLHITNHLMTGPLGNSVFCFLRITMFLSTLSQETLRFTGNKIHWTPRDESLKCTYMWHQNTFFA